VRSTEVLVEQVQAEGFAVASANNDEYTCEEVEGEIEATCP